MMRNPRMYLLDISYDCFTFVQIHDVRYQVFLKVVLQSD